MALLWCRQTAYDFPLALARNLAIAQKGRQDFLMPQVLAPRLELFRGLADILAELDKGISEAVRVEIRQAGTGKGFAKDRPNGRGGAPVLPCQPYRFKLAIRPQRNPRRRETADHHCPIVSHPGDMTPTPPQSREFPRPPERRRC